MSRPQAPPGRPRVLVVDDSPLMRELIAEILRHAPDLEVVGTARDGLSAWERVESLRPDVLTLDVEMPGIDGLVFLERLMRVRPTPVVMVSSATEGGSRTTLRALELGAVDFVTKPRLDVRAGTLDRAEELIDKVRAAARARPHRPSPQAPRAPQTPPSTPLEAGSGCVLAVGASTGGTEAIRELLEALPGDSPGIVIVQHMPPVFTRSFAERLDRCCSLRVSEARDGDSIAPGQALVAPGDRHLLVARRAGGLVARLGHGALVNRHRPSVDVLFHSVADQVGDGAAGVLLTGMGVDGAQGLLAMRRAGALTMAQDEASSVVFGMPGEAIARGAAARVLAPAGLAAEIARWAVQRRRRSCEPD